MEAGTLVEWLVKPGDRVERGDIVAVVETQKGAIEIEVFETGQIEQILVDLHSKVPVGTPLARIRTEIEAKTAVAAAAPVAPPAGVTEAPPSVSPAAPLPTRRAHPRRRSSACRALQGACEFHRPRDGSQRREVSILPRLSAAVPLARSSAPTSSVASAQPRHQVERSGRSGSISMPCGRQSPPPCRGRSAKSRTIISSIRSTSRRASNGSRARMRHGHPTTGC